MDKKHWIKDLNMTAYALHLPMGVWLSEVDPFHRKQNMELYKKSIILASEMCETNSPVVVLHSGGLCLPDMDTNLKTELLELKKELFNEELFELNKFLNSEYPHVTIGVENMPKYTIENNQKMDFIYGYEDDICLWINQLNLSNIGLTLDICHAQATCNFNVDKNIDSSFKNIDAYLNAYIPNSKLIHLSKGYNYIEKPLEHGQPFLIENKEDCLYLKNIFDKLTTLNYTNPITIETNEVDILDAVNFAETMNVIKNGD